MFFRIIVFFLIIFVALFLSFDLIADLGQNIVETNRDAAWAPDVIYYIARLSFVTLKYNSSIAAYKRAVKLYPSDDRTPEAIVKIAKSYERLGQYEKALSFYNYFIEKYPDHIALSEIQRSIEEIRRYDLGPIDSQDAAAVS